MLLALTCTPAMRQQSLATNTPGCRGSALGRLRPSGSRRRRSARFVSARTDYAPRGCSYSLSVSISAVSARGCWLRVGPVVVVCRRISGLAVAVGGSRLILTQLIFQGFGNFPDVSRALLYRIQPGGALDVVSAAAVLTAVGLLAAWLPARRAAQLDPIEVLRE